MTKTVIHPAGTPVLGYLKKSRGEWGYDGRICFSILFFKDPKDAAEAAQAVVKAGDTYNGGFFHGKPCGREPSWDYVDPDGVKWYAVTC